MAIGPDFVQNTENSYFTCIWPAAVVTVVVTVAGGACAETVARGLSMSCTLISEQMTPQIFAPIATTVACTRSPSLLLL